MSEEEIIGKINWAIHVNEMTKSINGDNTHISVNVLQGLLDLYNKEKALAKNHKTAFEKQTENLKEIEELYNKEKEKNKLTANDIENFKCQAYMLGRADENEAMKGVIQRHYVSKDKIKEKIRIRKEEKSECKDSIEADKILREIYVLEELVEE